MTVEIICADVRDGLARFPDGHFHCCVTSPPFWGLRDYGLEPTVWGPGCEHEWGERLVLDGREYTSGRDDGSVGRSQEAQGRHAKGGAFCRRCNAWRGTLGLEPTPELYVEHLVAVMREVRRVLRDDGTLWLNLGDSYTSGGRNRYAAGDELSGAIQHGARHWESSDGKHRPPMPPGLKPKDLVGIPCRVAFALQADGWWLRSDIIWSKKNCMPESVRDRPTRSHEMLFLLAKGQRSRRTIKLANLPDEFLHFNENGILQDAHAGPLQLCVGLAAAVTDSPQFQEHLGLFSFNPQIRQQGLRNIDRKLVVGLPPEHRPLADAATEFLSGAVSTKQFLQKLYGLGLRLGESNALIVSGVSLPMANAPGIHSNGKAAIRVEYAGEVCELDLVHEQIILERTTTCNYYYDQDAIREPAEYGFREQPSDTWGRVGTATDGPRSVPGTTRGSNPSAGRNRRSVWEIATQPYPDAHFATFPEKLVEPCILAGCPEGGTVLDPFSGSGTVGLVAERLGRHSVLIDAKEEYCAMARHRTAQRGLMLEAQ